VPSLTSVNETVADVSFVEATASVVTAPGADPAAITLAVPLMPEIVAVMVALPAATPVARPVELTLTALGLELVHPTMLPVTTAPEELSATAAS
jgi:hypothetical protein